MAAFSTCNYLGDHMHIITHREVIRFSIHIKVVDTIEDIVCKPGRLIIKTIVEVPWTV
jgi:hypothetical protein